LLDLLSYINALPDESAIKRAFGFTNYRYENLHIYDRLPIFFIFVLAAF